LRGWFAKWSIELSVTILSAAIVYGGTVVHDVIQVQERMTASEKDRATLHEQLEQIRKIQMQNSEFREATKAKMEDSEKQLNRIEDLLQEHMSNEQRNWNRHVRQ